MLAPWKESFDKPRQHIKKQRHHFAVKRLYSQSYGFSSSYVRIWELDHKEGWVLKNLCFWTVVLENTLESPLDCKETKPVNPKGNQYGIFIGRTGCWSSNTLATWCEKLTHLKRSHWKIEGQRRSRMQRTRWLDNITNSMDTNLSNLWDTVEDRGTWWVVVHGVAESDTTQWLKTTTKQKSILYYK